MAEYFKIILLLQPAKLKRSNYSFAVGKFIRCLKLPKLCFIQKEMVTCSAEPYLKARVSTSEEAARRRIYKFKFYLPSFKGCLFTPELCFNRLSIQEDVENVDFHEIMYVVEQETPTQLKQLFAVYRLGTRLGSGPKTPQCITSMSRQVNVFAKTTVTKKKYRIL